ncbi:LuxR family transcriptional regulator [Pseudonocardia alaniniphila]
MRLRGIAAERELPYAGLHLLCAPLLDDLDVLAPCQRAALATAVGLTTGGPPDHFLVSLATLNLLTNAAEAQPVCCIVDDTHWLDHASLLTLAFVARRVERGALVILFADHGRSRTELEGLPEMHLETLPLADARALLAAAAPGKIDAAVTVRVLIETGGNARELIEAFDGVSAVELAGGYTIPPRPGHSDVDHDCVQRARHLPGEARRLLLAAAADPTGDPTVVWRVAAALGIGPDAAEALEAQRLLVFGPRIVFGCARLRADVYAAAAPAELRAIHRALADATDGEADGDRRAWHLALSTSGPDDRLADRLERYAPTAQARGGIAALAAFLERATLLTADPACRARRALTAAAAQHAAGGQDAARRLLTIAEIGPLDEARRAWAALQRARIAFAVHRDNTALRPLLDAARRVEGHLPALAGAAYLEVLAAAMVSGHLTDMPSLRDVALAARSATAAGSADAIDLLVGALATRVLDGRSAAVVPLRRAVTAFSGGTHGSVTGDWSWLAGCVAADLWDERAWISLSSRQAHHDAAAQTDLSTPAHVLAQQALVDLYRGRFDNVRAALAEADMRAVAAGAAPLAYPSLLLAAWQGRHSILVDRLPEARHDARRRGDGLALTGTRLAETVLYNSVGDYEQALAAAQDVAESDQLGLSGWVLVELIEAAVRCGRADVAAHALGRLTDRTAAAATDWGAGIRAASRALLADAPDAEPLYEEAITRLSRTDVRLHLGRVQLLYGEWLRSRNRRADARKPLRAARELFATIGAEGFAGRARGELAATGEKASMDSRLLTPQESLIACLARDGLTNPEIGARLFVSRRTVEYHLHKVFVKLAITSRNELHLVLDTTADSPDGDTPRGATWSCA